MQAILKSRALLMITPIVFRHVSRKRIAKARKKKGENTAVAEESKKQERQVKRAKSALLRSEQEESKEKEEFRRVKSEEERKRAGAASKVTTEYDEPSLNDENASMMRIVMEEKQFLKKDVEQKKKVKNKKLQKKKVREEALTKEEADAKEDVKVKEDAKAREDAKVKDDAKTKEDAKSREEVNGKDDVVEEDANISPEACMQDLSAALFRDKEEAYLILLNTMVRLVKVELEGGTARDDVGTLLYSNSNVVVKGAEVFLENKKIVVAVLDTMLLFKSKIKKIIDLEQSDAVDILSAILKAYLGDVGICKKVLRLFDKKSLLLVDEDFVRLVVAMFQRHIQDEVIQKESINVFRLCAARDASFQSAVHDAGGCALILDLYAMQHKGIEVGELINTILVLSAGHADIAAYFGSMAAIIIYSNALMQNVYSETAFNLASVPIFYALKSFTDPKTFFVDASFLEPINNLFAYAEQIEDSNIAEKTLDWILLMVRELCTISSSKALFVRSHFSFVISNYNSGSQTKYIRKLAKSVVKKMLA